MKNKLVFDKSYDTTGYIYTLVSMIQKSFVVVCVVYDRKAFDSVDRNNFWAVKLLKSYKVSLGRYNLVFVGIPRYLISLNVHLK